MTHDQLSEGRLINTEQGETFVRILGNGPPVIVIHGGPGFDHNYLVSALEFLSKSRKLIFYDQPGCGLTPENSHPLTLELTAQHLRSVLDQTVGSGPVGVIAHSWGALVLAAALAGAQNTGRSLPTFVEGALINPAPLTKKDYQNVSRKLAKQIPLLVTIKCYAMFLAKADGAKIVDTLMPYYGSKDFSNQDGLIRLHRKPYWEISKSLGDFDALSAVSHLQDVSLIFGENDYAGPDFVGELAANARQTYSVQGAAHFPFLEAPEEFQSVASKIFTNS